MSSNKFEIWGEKIPYNNLHSKLADMIIHEEKNQQREVIKFALAASHLMGKHYRLGKRTLDTHTYMTVIKPGVVKETYEDKPYLLAYPVEGSSRAVIAVPGGGYAFTGISDTEIPDPQTEGGLFAKLLNEKGISCFVLSYRYNPYRMPVPLLDMQRAVRFLRFHAAEFGLQSEEVDIIGFSAGGYQVGGFINLIQGNNIFPQDYQPDEIDAMSDSVRSAAMFFPLLTFQYNQRLLHCCFPEIEIQNRKKRLQLLKDYDLKQHIKSKHIPQFIAHGTKDMLIKMPAVKGYVDELLNQEGNLQFLEVEDANHGFIAQEKYNYVFESYLEWLKNL